MNDAAKTIEDLNRVACDLQTHDMFGTASVLEEAVEFIEGSILRWSSDLPKVPGDYLMRARGSKTPVVFGTLSEQDIKNPPPWSRRYEFAGPFTVAEPKDTNQS